MLEYTIIFGNVNNPKSITVATNNLFMLKMLMIKHGLIFDLTEIRSVTFVKVERTVSGDINVIVGGYNVTN